MVDQLIINRHFDELYNEYPGLQLLKNDIGLWQIYGILNFAAQYEGKEIEDQFTIEIKIPEGYPETIPSVWETENRIPQNFHHYQDKSLCLGAPLAVQISFYEKPTLLGFVEKCLIPYLFGFVYKTKFDDMPYGELSHGGRGLYEYYQALFEVDNRKSTLGLLKIMAFENYRGHLPCPCGSSKRLRACHGGRVQKWMKILPSSIFKKEYDQLLKNI